MVNKFKNLCELNCVHKKKCNKKFAKILEVVDEKVVYIAAECGRNFRVEDI